MAKAIELPLDKYAALLESERQLNDLHGEFDKMEQCGIDCQYYRGVVAAALGNIQAIKQNYPPRQLPRD